ncbi:ferric reductase-like transmembrane domain-containing protein [Pseudolysinimonas kribbensis]|uniref:Oxidoreductase n=1 Tax=Pseudolysinimonas kribbensis TaxID=433641 RepID=A0ABQ6K414_9MICO|nr:ferredoxin reductase family protein [Pseudolysinimonas kribbensis]GMA95370.1 oxidoreductase [Pseudolysinimonas kribbensis]
MASAITAPALTSAAAPAAGRALRHRRRLRRADLLTVVAWASAALAVAMYLTHGVALAGIGDLLTAGGIVAGLVGSDLVLVMLVLAARVPLIDRTIGHDRAMAVHRQLGKPAFYLLLAHGVLLTLGYAWADRANIVAETASLIGAQDMPIAYLSLGLFVAVIVTSLVAVRRKLRYEVWHLIHLLSYAAVLTALPHQFSQGTVFAADTPQRVYWIALYVLALGAIVTFRFVEPAVQSMRHRIVVDRVERIAPDAISIHLRGRDLDRLGAQGGQFFTWRFWTGRTWWHAHPLSLSSVPTSRTARITVRELGDGTRALQASLRHGTPVTFEGPYGIFTDAARGRERVAVFAAGIGVTPARALLERLDAGRGMVSVIVRASDPRSLFLWDEILRLCQDRGWNAWVSIGRRGSGSSSWLSAADAHRGVSMRSAFPHLDDSEVYICGPDSWADAVEHEAHHRGVASAHIHRERFEL